VYDVDRLDRYGRTLAYVYRASDARFVNASLVRNGFARAYTVPPNVEHADDFVTWEREAREAERGLWSACR
jgi:micrococcal nuclease